MSRCPKVTVDIKKLRTNAKTINNLCVLNDITFAGVVKGCNGIPKCAEILAEEGAEYIASSRLSQLKKIRKCGIYTPMMLIRIPMISEAEETVKWTDISLNSEMEVIRAINAEAEKQNKIHSVILMVDLGDLREGFWEDEKLLNAVKEIEFDLANVYLAGVGTNLGCYGAISATEEKMQQLVSKAKIVEEVIGRKLDYVSGGGTTSIPRIIEKDMPKEVNMLRIGEAVLLGRDLKDIFPKEYGKIHNDVFKLHLEVIEIKDKPTYPVGEIICDGFGLHNTYEDRGIRKRALLAAGKIDYGFPEMLIPTDKGVSVVGASSDHTIVDIEDSEAEIAIGDILTFELSYANLVYATSSEDVEIEIIV